ncbi:MAG: hypothetical protein ACREMV_00795, partial [Gemmatimonadales bacterium]
FQIMIPITTTPNLGAGLQVGDPFDMWYSFIVYLDAPNAPAQYHWPRSRMTDPNLQTIDLTTLARIPNPAAGSPGWAPFTRGPASSACVGDVALDPVHIGTLDPALTTPSSKISLTGPNAFVARPTNKRPAGGAPLVAHTITADFFLANWGSVPDPTTLWKKINTSTPDNERGIPATETAHGDPARNDIQFSWTVPAADRCRYDPTCTPPGQDHQCLLVELSNGAALTFLNKSAYRNMDFVSTASAFSRDAQISVVGLEARPGTTTRDVYLYVETSNLPAQVGAKYLPAERIVLADTLLVVRGDSVRIGRVRVDTVIVPAAAGGGRGRTLNLATARGLLKQRQVDGLMPTYRVHVYHDTGDSTTVRGRRRPILRAQTSFGYWVDHTGALGGWSHRLEGASVQPLGSGWYRISVPHDSFATVTTIIEALEPKRFALSLHAGVSLPHGSFSNAVDPGFGVTADLEVRLNHTFTAEALFGFHRFSGVAGGPDVDLTHISGGLKAYVTPGPTRLFVNAGGGTYTFDPGGTDPGAHAGAGVQFNPSHRIALEAVYTAHTVFTSGSSTTFSSIQAGGRIRL